MWLVAAIAVAALSKVVCGYGRVFAVQQDIYFRLNVSEGQVVYINCDTTDRNSGSHQREPAVLFVRFYRTSPCTRFLRSLNYRLQGRGDFAMRELVVQEIDSCHLAKLKTIIVRGEALVYVFRCTVEFSFKDKPPWFVYAALPFMVFTILLLVTLLLFVPLNFCAMKRYFAHTISGIVEITPAVEPSHGGPYIPGWRNAQAQPDRNKYLVTQSTALSSTEGPTTLALGAESNFETQQLMLVSELQPTPVAGPTSQMTSDFHTEPLLAISQMPTAPISSTQQTDVSDIVQPSVQQEG